MGSETGGASADRPEADAELDLDTPNCIVCLHRMEPAETAGGAPYWHCEYCGASRLT